MKKLSFLSIGLTLALFSCSSDDSSDPAIIVPEVPTFAMSAKLNTTIFEANNPFGTNAFSSTNIWSYFPLEDYVMLQGRKGGIAGNPEINIWLKRSDIAVGTFPIGQETFDTPPSHFIDLIDNSNDISENTKSGTIIITEVNTTTKIVKGTFQFTTVENVEDPAATVDFNVTDGKFRYTYE